MNGTKEIIPGIAYISKMYDLLNEVCFNNELEKPVIAINLDNRQTGKGMVLGWFSSIKIRKGLEGDSSYELNISSNYLDRSSEEIAETLLHEMCHQFAIMHNIKDTSRSGQYHNKEFQKIATEHGLVVLSNGDNGFNDTALTEKTKELIKACPIENPMIYRRITEKDIKDAIGMSISPDDPDREKRYPKRWPNSKGKEYA